MDPFIHGDTNVTGFRFVNPSNPQVIDVSSDWRLHQNRLGFSPMENDRGFTVSHPNLSHTCITYTYMYR